MRINLLPILAITLGAIAFVGVAVTNQSNQVLADDPNFHSAGSTGPSQWGSACYATTLTNQQTNPCSPNQYPNFAITVIKLKRSSSSPIIPTGRTRIAAIAIRPIPAPAECSCRHTSIAKKITSRQIRLHNKYRPLKFKKRNGFGRYLL